MSSSFTTLPAARAERFAVLERFSKFWNVPWQPGSQNIQRQLNLAELRLGLKLPPALREWYALNGVGISQWKTEQWLPPAKIEHDDAAGLLVFRVDDPAAEDRDSVWGVRVSDLGNDDPPVLHHDVVLEETTTDADSFSVHVIQQSVFEAKRRAVISTVNDITDLAPAELSRSRDVLQSLFTPTDLGLCRFSIWDRTQILEGDDLLAVDARTSNPKYAHEGYLYFAARTEQAWLRLPRELRDTLRVWTSEPPPELQIDF